MATNTLSLVEQCRELVKENGPKVNTALATLMLACQLQVATAQTAPASPADSAIAAAAKGYGQKAILKDGSKMSFAEIAGLPADKKDDILDNLTEIEIRSYQEWRKGMKQVANQRIEEKKGVAEVANQETIILRIANVEKLKKIAEANGWKLTKSDENYLKNIVADGKPPIDEAKYILSKATFA